MAAYFLRFRLDHKTSSIIPDSDGYAPFPGQERNPRHPDNWTVVVDVRRRVVVRETDRVIATAMWDGDDVIDPIATLVPDIPSTESWVFIAEHLRELIAAPECSQHHVQPDWIDDGAVEPPAPAPHPHVARTPRPAEPAPPAPAPVVAPPTKSGVIATIIVTLVVLLAIAGFIAYQTLHKST